MENLKVSTGTIARTIALVIALINQLCAYKGWVPLDIDENAIYEVLTVVATFGTAIVAWWKNNSFTQAAKKGDEAKEIAKAEAMLAGHYDDNRMDIEYDQAGDE